MIYRNEMRLWLASSSPRRREMLGNAGIEFELIRPEGEDITFRWTGPRYYAERKATLKLEDTVAKHPELDGCIVTADTIVALKRDILEKPRDPADAHAMLRRLSGKWHSVYTAYCIAIPSQQVEQTRSVRTYVKFRALPDAEIAAYIATGEPMDKAGAYAIQGIGAFMVEAIDGSFTNVIGLPLTQLLEDLERLRVITPRRP